MLSCCQRSRYILICVVLTAGTLAGFWPVVHNGFINYDDQDYLTENVSVQAGLGWRGVVWAFTTGHAGNWHPITWMSHMLDCQLYGLNPAGHHVSSLVLHVVNVLLLLAVLYRLTGALWPSAFVAGLFAWHPLHVESVAWAAERKDVLSTLFFLLTLGTYARYAQGQHHPLSTGPRVGAARGKHYAYGLALLFFALGLMSKPMLVTVPFLLLLLDYWPLQRLSRLDVSESTRARVRRLVVLVVEKLPFFALALASSIITLIVQRRSGAVAGIDVLPLDRRLENVAMAYALYPWKMLWPTGLAPFYPMPAEYPLEALLSGTGLWLGVTVAAVALAKRIPSLVVGWFWYLGTLVPVIGLVQVGGQSLADRYTYIPLIGLFLAITWGYCQAAAHWHWPGSAGGAGAAVVLVPLLVLTFIQVQRWKDSEMLFGHALKVTTGNYVAHRCVGCELVKRGQIEAAAEHFAAAIRFKPNDFKSRNDLGLALMILGKPEEAIREYSEALERNPRLTDTHYNLARALESQGRLEEALGHYQQAVQLNPASAEARAGLSLALGKLGRDEAASESYAELIRLRPDDADAHYNLANLLKAQAKFDEAIAEYAAALRLKTDDPEAREQLGLLLLRRGRSSEAGEQFLELLRFRPDGPAHYYLALALDSQGRSAEALPHYRRAAELQPDWPVALNDLAWFLATCPTSELRDGAEAVRLARRACELTGSKQASFLGTLDAAYAAAGRFEEAVATACKARDLALASRQADIANAAEERLKLYEQRRAFQQRR